MMILFPKDRYGVKIALKLIFEAMEQGASYTYIIGMIDFARQFGAITAEEEKALTEYLIERERVK